MKKSIYGCFAFLSLCIILFTSCKNETVEPTNVEQYRYFPLVTGFWTEYSVDSIVHLDIDDTSNPPVDTAIRTYHFQIREEVDTAFQDAVNETAYVIKRYRRDADSLPWQFINIWVSKVNGNSAQRVEDNIRFVRMQFPIESSALWNGNAFNFFPEEEYTYEDLFEQRTYNGLQFPSTVTVLQNDFISNINRVTKMEIYGKDVGMIYKQLDSIRTKNTQFGTVILNGLEYKLSVINYKN